MENKLGIKERLTACEIVINVLQNHIFLDNLTKSEIVKEETPFIKMLTYTYFRHKAGIDNIIKQKIAKPLPDKAIIANVAIGLGITELLFLNTPNYAVINSYVEIVKGSKLKYLEGLTNAVLRKCMSLDAVSLKPQTANWLEAELIRDYGEKTTNEILKIYELEPYLDISVKENPEHWAAALSGKVIGENLIRLNKTTNIVKIESFTAGDWWVQDISASLPVKLMGDIKGKRVLDMCAAPGGKTFQLISKGANVTAIDKSEKRLKKMQENLSRLNLTPKSLTCADGIAYKNEDLFDIVLLDAPCSATGTIRKHPELPYIKSSEQAKELNEIQLALLENAVKLTKPDGYIYYCTCSLNKDEGEKQIANFVKKNKEIEFEPFGEREIKNHGFSENFISSDGNIRILPFYLNEPGGMDGFFISRLKKI